MRKRPGGEGESKGMRAMDWISVLVSLLAALYAGRSYGWAVGVAAFFASMFLFAIARFTVAIFRGRKGKR
jgi:Na+-driven multidrug efflux pump